MKAKELKDMEVDELKKMLFELQKDLMKERTQVARATSKSSGRITKIKRTIARIKTILKEKGG